MALSKIKKEYQSVYVAFGKGTLPLGQREDIDDLAIMALESNNKMLLQYFEELPQLGELKKKKVENELKGVTTAKVKKTVSTKNEQATKQTTTATKTKATGSEETQSGS